MNKNTIKLLNEYFTREVKSMFTRFDLSEYAKRDVYYRIMKFKQLLLKQGIQPELVSNICILMHGTKTLVICLTRIE